MNVISESIRTIKNWWLFVLLGISMIICGIWVFMTPAESYLSLAILFSVLVFVNGVFEVFFSISNRKSVEGWGWYLAGGVGKTIIGVVLMTYPAVSVTILPLIVGFWLMFGAISTIAGAFDLKSYHIKDWGWVLTFGILLSIFSFFVIANPLFGGGTIVIMTSVAMIMYGISYISFGMQLRKIKKFASEVKDAAFAGFNDLKNKVTETIKNIDDVDKEKVRNLLDEYQNSVK